MKIFHFIQSCSNESSFNKDSKSNLLVAEPQRKLTEAGWSYLLCPSGTTCHPPSALSSGALFLHFIHEAPPRLLTDIFQLTEQLVPVVRSPPSIPAQCQTADNLTSKTETHCKQYSDNLIICQRRKSRYYKVEFKGQGRMKLKCILPKEAAGQQTKQKQFLTDSPWNQKLHLLCSYIRSLITQEART